MPSERFRETCKSNFFRSGTEKEVSISGTRGQSASIVSDFAPFERFGKPFSLSRLSLPFNFLRFVTGPSANAPAPASTRSSETYVEISAKRFES